MKKYATPLILTLCVLLLFVSCGKTDAEVNTAQRETIYDDTAGYSNISETESQTEVLSNIIETTDTAPSTETTLRVTAKSGNNVAPETTAVEITDFSDSSGGDADSDNYSEPTALANASPVVRIYDSNIVTGFENEMLARVNKERAANGLSALVLDTQLCYDAQLRASEIIDSNNFSHTRPDGTQCFTAFYNSYQHAAENIAMGTWGYYDTQKIMDGWMNSPPHKANILKDDINKVGFGCYHSGDNGYWVQLFTD